MRRFEPKASRFSNRVLLTYAATGKPEGLQLRNRTSNTPAEILLYDEIGLWGTSAKDFISALRDVGEGPLTLRINSPGGEVFDGLAIYNAVRGHKGDVLAVVDGMAASAASFIALAANTVEMAESAFLMIHNSQGLAYGDRHTMTDMVSIMAKLDAQLATIYAGKSGMSVEDVGKLLDAETWYTSSEALEAKLIDRIGEAPEVTAMAPVKPGAFAHVPPAVADQTDPAKLLADATEARRRLLRLVEAEV